jgi:hypothetical protein
MDYVSRVVNGCKDYVSEKKKEIGIYCLAGIMASATPAVVSTVVPDNRVVRSAYAGDKNDIIGNAIREGFGNEIGKSIFGGINGALNEMFGSKKSNQSQQVRQETRYREPEVIICDDWPDKDGNGVYEKWERNNPGKNYFNQPSQGEVRLCTNSEFGLVTVEIKDIGTGETIKEESEWLLKNQLLGGEKMTNDLPEGNYKMTFALNGKEYKTYFTIGKSFLRR